MLCSYCCSSQYFNLIRKNNLSANNNAMLGFVMSKLALLLSEHMDLYGSLLLLLVPNHKSTKTLFATFILYMLDLGPICVSNVLYKFGTEIGPK